MLRLYLDAARVRLHRADHGLDGMRVHGPLHGALGRCEARDGGTAPELQLLLVIAPEELAIAKALHRTDDRHESTDGESGLRVCASTGSVRDRSQGMYQQTGDHANDEHA